jgi:hypothetical protein
LLTSSEPPTVAACPQKRKTGTVQVLIVGWSFRTTFSNELWTSMPPL